MCWLGAQTATLPSAGPPEAAFVGRSNVGKSSLVNMVVGRRAMAYTSKTPGKTQQFNYFNVNGESTFDPKGEFLLVDLPGVGYAKVPRHVREDWVRFMTEYFYTRPSLKVRAREDWGRYAVPTLGLCLFPLRNFCDPALSVTSCAALSF